jgi:hypothetical protein
VAGEYFPDIFKHAVSAGPGRAYAEDLVETRLADPGFYAGETQESFDLGGEDHGFFNNGIEQRFDPGPISVKHKALHDRVHDGYGKDAVELCDKVRTIFQVGGQDDFRVAGSLEAMAKRFQFIPQLMGVVQFPVVDDAPGPAVICFEHGLVSGDKIYNGQPHVSQAEMGGEEGSAVVRSPTLQL